LIDKSGIEESVRRLLLAIGEDPERPGLVETPQRVAAMFEEICRGYGHDPGEVIKIVGSQGHDEIVLVKDIPFYSLCEHHLLPFLGKAHVAYLPVRGNITGISKLARVVDVAAGRLQIQERLTTEVADAIMRALKPRGVLVIMEAEHLCMTMRGVRKPGSKTVTSVVRGIFRDNPATRSEAMSLIYGRSGD